MFTDISFLRVLRSLSEMSDQVETTTIYLSKLPRLEKKVRVALDWTLDLLFSKDLVHLLDLRPPSVSQAEEDADTTLVASEH